eukprot:Gb_29313 [translate_table: standard]
MYAWALWVADRFKEHCLASQMFGRPFPMPSLLAIICMDALGPPGWIKPNEQPRLNAYSCLKRRREDAKDRGFDAYLGKVYLALRGLNDSPEKSRKLPEYIKKKWKELVVDYPLTSPIAQYHYWAVNKEHFSKEPHNMAWSPPDLPLIPFPEIQEKGGTIGKEKEKKRSTTKGEESLKGKHSEVDSEQRTSKKERKRQKSGETQGHRPRIDNENRSIRVRVGPSGPPSLRGEELIKPKRSCIVERDWKPLKFLLKCKPNCCNWNPKLLGSKDKIDEMQLEAKQKDQEVTEHIDEIQRLKVVPTQFIVDVQRKLALARDNICGLREHITHNIDQVPKGEKMQGVQFARLTEICNRLAAGKAMLAEGYWQISGITNLQQRVNKEITLLQKKEEISSLESQVLLEKESCLGGHMKNKQLMEKARSLVNRAGRPTLIGSQILLIPQNIESGKKNPKVVLVEKQSGPLGNTSLVSGNQVYESTRETEAPRTSGEPRTILSSIRGEDISVALTNQPKGRPPGSPRRVFEAEKALTIFHPLNPSDVDKSLTAIGPSQSLAKLVANIPLAPLSSFLLAF